MRNLAFLPPELLTLIAELLFITDHVIESTDGDDNVVVRNPDLAALSQVSRSFRSIALPLLFRKLVVEHDGVLDFLIATPDLAGLVQSLVFFAPDELPVERDLCTYSRKLQRVFALLPQLSSLVLDSRRSIAALDPGALEYWLDLPWSTLLAALPSNTSTSGQLTRLSVLNVAYLETTADFCHTLKDMVCGAGASLRVLDVEERSFGLSLFLDTISPACPNLEALSVLHTDLHDSFQPAHPYYPDAFSRFHRLRVLRLSSHLDYDDPRPFSPPPPPADSSRPWPAASRARHRAASAALFSGHPTLRVVAWCRYLHGVSPLDIPVSAARDWIVYRWARNGGPEEPELVYEGRAWEQMDRTFS